jgi:tyrosyl-tRNA synthetase
MKMLTFLPISDIEEIEKAMGKEGYVPNTAQVRLAEEITKFVHGETGLEEAKAATKGLLPGSDTKLDIDTLESLVDIVPTSEITREEAFTLTVVDILVKVGLQGSKGEARRMIKGGGVRINNIKVADEAAQLKPSDLISGRMLLLSAGKKNKFLLQVKE